MFTGGDEAPVDGDGTMQINGREIEYIGNNGWHVDGQYATVAAWGSSDLKIQATREVVALTEAEASAIRQERDAAKAAAAPVRNATRPASTRITSENLAYHMYSRNGHLFG